MPEPKPNFTFTPYKTLEKQENISREEIQNMQEVFKLNPELEEAVYKALGLESNKDIVISLGRRGENVLGKIQNINVYYKGQLIVDSDNSRDKNLIIVTKEDGTSYVGNIFLPTELQAKGLGVKILQKVANTLDIKIIPMYIATDPSAVVPKFPATMDNTSDYAKKMWEKVGNEIKPNHELERLYKKYLENIYPESQVKDIFWHGSKKAQTIESFTSRYFNSDFNIYVNGIYFSKDRNYADDYKKGRKEDEDLTHSGLLPVVLNIKNLKQAIDGPRMALIDDESLKKFEAEGIDALTFEEETVVFNPEQIHILGSKTDIKQFRSWLENQNEK